MKRILEPIDLMVAIGFCATIAGGYGVYMATSGVLEAAAPSPVSMVTLSDQEWIQPVLGQAIVDSILVGREATRTIHAVTRKLERSVESDRYLRGLLPWSVAQVKTHAAAVDADHAARVQFVIGRFIVNGTARGVRTGMLSPAGLSNGFNHRLIKAAEAMGHRMDTEFRTYRQANLDWGLAEASRDYESGIERSQQRIGYAVVRATSAQDRIQAALETAQHQVASAVLAALRVGRHADLLARAVDSRSPAKPAVMETRPRSWPEIPIGGFMLASIALLGVFVGGLMTPAGLTEAEKEEKEEKVYRKTA